MKYLKLWENLNNEGDFYSKFQIDALTKEYGSCEIDKYKSIKPLYDGGTYSQIGYLCNIEDEQLSKFIIEGITSNGKFIKSSIIIFDENDYAIVHGSVYIDDKKEDIHSDNISKMISAINDYIEKIKND